MMNSKPLAGILVVALEPAGAIGRCHGLFKRDDEDACQWFAVHHGLG